MAEEIRGLSIKFDADFSEFKKNMKSADKDINSTQRKLKTLQDSLKMEWDPKKFTKAQSEAQKALDATEKKASLLRKRLAEMDQVGVTDATRDQYNYLSEQLEKADLNAQKLKKELEQLDNIKMKQLTAGIDSATKKLETAAQKTRGLSMAAAGALVGLAGLTTSAVAAAAEIDDLAQRSGISAEKIQELQYVTMQTGIETKKLVQALIKSRAAYADMGTGTINKQVETLQKLGIAYGELNQEEVFDAVITALSKIDDATLQAAYANEIFGDKVANDLIPLLTAGEEAIAQFKEEFSGFDSLTNEQVAAMAAMDDEIYRMKQEFSYLSLQMAADLLPVMKDLVKIVREDVIPALRSLIDWFTGLDPGTQKAILGFLAVIAVLSPLLTVMSKTGSGISSLIKWLGKLDAAALKTYASWGLLFAAIGALFYLLSNWSNMNPVQKIVGLLGALTAIALSAAIAMGAFQSALSWGAAAAGIVAGIVAVTAAVKSAGDQASESTGDLGVAGYNTSYNPVADMTIPQVAQNSGSVTTNDNSYVDNSNVVINIEKNEYMSEDEIIRAVNKGLKLAKQSRT